MRKVRYLHKILTLVILSLSFQIYSQDFSNSPISFSHNHGFYDEPFDLEISTELVDSKIYYTLDGSNPYFSDQSIVSDTPTNISINPNNTMNRDRAPGVVVRACIVNSDTIVGEVVTQTYLFIDEVRNLSQDGALPGTKWLNFNSGHAISYGLDPDIYENSSYSTQLESGLLSIPTISVVTNLDNLFDADSGIYVNSLKHGKEWERNCSIEQLNPDGTKGFQVNCGIRIRGGWSRHDHNPKHAFRFIFRGEYGASKLKYPLFGDQGVDEFDNIDLRTSQNYSWSFYGDENNTFMRDVFSRDTQGEMGHPHTRSKFYHLFINGTYWGLYQSQERSEASFAESYFGGNSSDYDVIKVDVGENFNKYVVEATDGTLDKWRELWDAAELGFANDELYFKIQGQNTDGSRNPQYERLLDIDNLIDYMIITFFVGDFDGPISAFRNNETPNNFYAIINRENPDGFKFFRHDAEHSMFDHNWGIDRTGHFIAGQLFEFSNPQWIHQKLSENEKYKLRFTDRVYKHFKNDGVLTLANNRSRINKRKSEIETAIVAESARWGDAHPSRENYPLTKNDWETAVDWILNSFLPSREIIVLNQLMNKGLYSQNTPPQFSINGGIVEKGTEVELSSSSDQIYYTLDGTDPLAFSANNSNFSEVLIDLDATKYVMVPKSPMNNLWMSDIDFDDSNWNMTSSLPGGVGYGDKYGSYISYSTYNDMSDGGSNPNTSCFLRIKFNTNDVDFGAANKLYFDIMYDDGFIAYINGVEIQIENAPPNPSWSSAAQTYLDSQGYVRFDISEHLSTLKSGENLLAIHGVNISTQSSDFLILPKLIVEKSGVNGVASSSASLYSDPITINETTTIKTRTLVDEKWSALNENKFLVRENLEKIKITELHYHPLNEIVGQDTINDTEYEFIEIKNIGSSELNLTGAYFSQGISYEFPQNSLIEPGEFIVLASNIDEFNRRYGFNSFGEYEGQFNNGGERVTFLNAAGDTIFTFRYNDKSPWPIEADGDGYSLVSQTRNPTGNPENVDYWSLSSSIGGSPMENDIVSDVTDRISNIPEKLKLSQNYPNPFNPTTTIKYSIPKLSSGREALVQIVLYDVLGRKLNTLTSKPQNPGNYELHFDATHLASGVYYYQLNVDKLSITRKMILLK